MHCIPSTQPFDHLILGPPKTVPAYTPVLPVGYYSCASRSYSIASAAPV